MPVRSCFCSPSWFAATAFLLLWQPLLAQALPSAFTTGYRFDLQRHLVGMISPDPDGAGALVFPAARYSYDIDGQLVRIEKGKLTAWAADTVPPSAWAGFTVLQQLDYAYDVVGNKIEEKASSGGVVTALTQYSYDANDRLICTAVRMNLGLPPATGSDACISGTPSGYGADRITRTVYDAAGQVVQVQKAVGTPIQQNYATYTYSANGKQLSITDANGNKAAITYDGFDRKLQWQFPSKTSVGQVSTADYEQYGYDAGGNRISLRKRDGQTITYSYDALGRVTLKDLPGTAADVVYSYDLRGLQLTATFNASGQGLTNAYDGAGRLISNTNTTGGTSRALAYQYDANGNRTRVTHPDGAYFTYEYDGLNRVGRILENGVASGTGVLVQLAYDDLGRRTSLTRGNTVAATSYSYDSANRLAALTHDLDGPGTGSDVTQTFAYSPASQMVTRALSNDAYVFTDNVNLNRPYAVNGLNQYSAAGATGAASSSAFSYDGNGNLTADAPQVNPTTSNTLTYSYDTENRLVGASGAKTLTLAYDPLGRLSQTSGGSALTTRFLYDGDALIAEYDGNGSLLRRYVHGPELDEPLVWYEGSGVGTTPRRYLFANHQGSIIAVSDGNGAMLRVKRYDAYGIPDGAISGVFNGYSRFQYTGQIAIPEIGLYHYKARAYSPTLGRFLQTDPIGYDDQINLYAYVANDPVDGRDPTGMVAGVDDAVVAGVVVVAVGAAVACEATGACEKFSQAVYEGVDRLGDYIFNNDSSSSGDGDKKPVPEGVSSGSRGAVPGTGRRAGDVKPAWVKPGQDGAPRTGPKEKKSDGSQEATRGGRFGGVQGSRTQGGKFNSGKGGDGRRDSDGHRGGPGHDHPPETDGGGKKGHWWWPW